MTDSDHAQRLATILTPRLLQEAFEARIPWPKHRDLDFAAVVHWYLLGEFDVAGFRAVCYDALQELSEIPLDEMPDLMQYLPSPEDGTFPLQAYGLLILLDQAPRMMLEGMDERWLLGFFDPLAEKVARRLVRLPKPLRPDSVQRWYEMGYTFGHWLVANLWFIAVFAHTEEIADHETMLVLVAEMRVAVQEHTKAGDPYTSIRDETLSDPNSFLKAGEYGPPKGDDVPLQDYAYWMFMLYESHYATLRHFGRVPFYNGALGREDTEDEKRFLANINRMGCVTPETEKRIRDDVRESRWTRLGG